jgi:hypothetical protein
MKKTLEEFENISGPLEKKLWFSEMHKVEGGNKGISGFQSNFVCNALA